MIIGGIAGGLAYLFKKSSKDTKDSKVIISVEAQVKKVIKKEILPGMKEGLSKASDVYCEAMVARINNVLKGCGTSLDEVKQLNTEINKYIIQNDLTDNL